MKKLPFVLFICLVPLVLRAQQAEFGFNAGPALSHRYLQSGHKEYEAALNASERPILGYRLGFDVVLRPQAKWQVGTGLQYNLRGFSSKVTLTDWNGTPSDSRTRKHLHYLEIPVFLKYRFGVRAKQNFYALAGVNNTFYLSHVTAVREGGYLVWMGEGEKYRQYNAGAVVGLGLRHQLTDKVLVEAGPQATMQFENLFVGRTPARRYLYTVGLNFRAAYRL
jgi:hypothetical protein